MRFKALLQEKKPYIKKTLRLSAVLTLLSLALGICVLVLTVTPTDFSLIKILITDIGAVFFNTLPLLCIMALLYCAFGRLWLAFLITSLLGTAIAEINRFKITFRGDPFVFEDILLISEAEDMLGKYKLFLDGATAAVLLFIAAATAAVFFIPRIKLKRRGIRAAGAVLALAALLISCRVFCFSDSVYNPEIHTEFGGEHNESARYMSGGTVYSFIKSIPEAFLLKPEGYSEEKEEKIYSNFENVPLSESNRVNIISVMFEAYNDLSDFGVIDFETDPYENFHRLRDDSYSGKLYTNIFAGGTVETERSFLTGYSDIRLKKGGGSSFVRYFGEQGYFTEAMHPGYGWFYGRDEKNMLLGFDAFKCFENTFEALDEKTLKAPKYQGMISNTDLVGMITESCDGVLKKGKNYFNFSVTYENHGPYGTERISDKTFAVRKKGYTEAEYNILNNYLSGIYSTDAAIKELRDYADKSEEPIVLILFGDHNPWLGDNNSVYGMLGISLDLNTEQGAKNYYQTPYLIYANKAAKEKTGKSFCGEGATISPMFLMAEYFDYINADGSPYLNYLKELKAQLDVINEEYVKYNGEFISRNSAEAQMLLAEQSRMEYYVKSIKAVS